MLTQIALISFIIIGLHSAMQEGMVLAFVPRLLSPLPLWLRKPLFQCMICMSSFWTITIWFISGHPLSIDILFTIPAVAGLNTLADAFLGYIREH